MIREEFFGNIALVPLGHGRWFQGRGERLGLGQWARRLRWGMGID